MTRDQKEKYVLELYQQGKTFREIAGLSHTSFSQIDKIIKRYKEEIDGQNNLLCDFDIRSKSKESKAFKLFSDGKSPIESCGSIRYSC